MTGIARWFYRIIEVSSNLTIWFVNILRLQMLQQKNLWHLMSRESVDLDYKEILISFQKEILSDKEL